MYCTIRHLSSAIGLVMLALPYLGPHDALRSVDDRLADAAHPTDVAAPPALPATVDQPPQRRIVDQVRIGRRQAQAACIRVVPDLTTASQTAAREALGRLNLSLGRVHGREMNRPRGTIVDQAPKAGTRVACGSPVEIWIAVPVSSQRDDVQPEPPCLVPSLRGHQLDDARRQLAHAKLEVGKVNTRESDRVRGTVISQSPASGRRVRCGSPIDVWVATPLPCPPVPHLIGRDPKTAAVVLERAGFRIGSVSTRESEQAVGVIVEQAPTAGSEVTCGTSIAVWVAAPPLVVRVPTLLGDGATDARRTLEGVGLRLGEIGRRASEEETGTVIDQLPRQGTLVKPGTAVQVWLATVHPRTVPDLRGRDRRGASEALTTARLQLGETGERPSDDPAGTVVDQSPRAGATVDPGTPVQVWFAVPRTATVPDLRGRDRNGAIDSLTRAGLRLGDIAERPSDRPVGTVVDQTPPAGQLVGVETAVDLWIATPLRILVPDLRGRSQADAIGALKNAGLTIAATLEREGPEPQGTVAHHQPAAGVEVDAGTAVSLWIAVPAQPALVEVPDVGGRTRSEAERIITDRSLALSAATTTEASLNTSGTVVRQEPAAGVRVTPGTVVTIVLAAAVATAPVVRVPSVAGLSVAQAHGVLRVAGLQPGAVNQARAWAAAGIVTSQRPEAGSSVEAGATVDLVVASSSAAFLWVLAGLGLGLAAAAGGSRLRGRNRLPRAVTLAPYADAGIQVCVPADGALAESELSLQSFRDDGVQALQGTLVIGEIAEAR